jgi:hypothetical protein
MKMIRDNGAARAHWSSCCRRGDSGQPVKRQVGEAVEMLWSHQICFVFLGQDLDFRQQSAEFRVLVWNLICDGMRQRGV